MEGYRSMSKSNIGTSSQTDTGKPTNELEDPGPGRPLKRIRWVMERLRSKSGGCPWDLKQNHVTLKPYMLEEACEVLDAIDLNDDKEICQELGDVLLQIVFHAQIARERGAFDLDDVANGISEKLIGRHPHVFGDTEVQSAEEVLQNWERIKLRKEDKKNVLAGIPRSLPALLAAYRIQEKVSSLGFDWKCPAEVVPKVHEEVDEFIEAFSNNDFERSEEEFGDLLFSLVNLARHAGINAEFAIKRANAKFRSRFTAMEAFIAEDGKRIDELGLEEMDGYWDAVKEKEQD